MALGRNGDNISRTVNKIFAAMLFICVLAAAAPVKSEAASADITFTSESKTYETGDVFNVELNISADVFPGDFTGYIRYSSDIIEYIGENERIAGGEGILKINDTVTSSDRNTRKYVLKFRAEERGFADISMRDGIELYEFEEGYLMSVSCNTLTLSIGAGDYSSSDCTLQSLKINPGKLDSAFLPDVYEYSTTVPYDTEKLIISAVPSDEEAEVSVGNNALSVGQNRIVIEVTAEDGSTAKYVLYCVRESEKRNTTEVEPTETAENANYGTGTDVPENAAGDITDIENYRSFYAEVVGDDTVIFSDNLFYTAVRPEAVKIPENYTETSLAISGIRVTAYVPKGNPSSEFLLMYLKNADGNEGFYRYDRSEKTIQRYTPGESKGLIVSDDRIENEELKKSYEKSLGTMTLIIAVLSAVCMLLLIVVIRFAVKAGRDEME